MRASRHQAWGYAAAVALTIVIGVIEFWPTLEFGLSADDYMAVAIVDGTFSAPRSRFDAFDFAGGTPQDVAAAQRLGTLTWWTPPNLRFSFLRPLSSALWWLDETLFGRELWAYHAHSIALWALLAVVTSLLYRRLLRPSAAALATAIFALDQSQHTPVQWLCNRGALYAVLLGVLALGSHLAWRERAARWGAWACAACTALAVLFGEWALPMLAYIAAYELVAGSGSRARRALCLLPCALPAGAFVLARALLHYGVRGSGVYVDPGSEPLRFLGLLTHRVPVLLADILFGVSAQWWDVGSPWRDRVLSTGLFRPEVWAVMPDWRVFHALIGAAALAVLAFTYRALQRTLGDSERRVLSFLVLGGLLALVPVAGSFASTRLTLAAMFGLAPAIALALRQLSVSLLWAAGTAPALRGGALGRGLASFMPRWVLLIAIVCLQLIAPLRVDRQAEVDGQSMAREWVRGAELDPRAVAGQRVFLLTSSEFVSTVFFAYTWGYHHGTLPRSSYPISMAPVAHDIERTAINELELRALGGTFLASAGEEMFRTPRKPVRLGTTVKLDGMMIGVLSLQDGKPQTIRVRFDRPLEDPSYVFLVAKSEGLVRFTPPALGETVRLPRPSRPSWYEPQYAREERRRGMPPEAFAFEPVPPFVDYELRQ